MHAPLELFLELVMQLTISILCSYCFSLCDVGDASVKKPKIKI